MSQIPVYTIGYGKRSIEAFTAVLQTHQIAYLIDVRSQPYSRHKPDFSRKALAGHLQQCGIRYVFMGDTLGGRPTDAACYSNGRIDYDKISQQPFYHTGIGRVQSAWQQQLTVALMCSEGKPERCHRSLLIGETLIAQGIEVIHIDENDQPLTHSDVSLRLNGGQTQLLSSRPQAQTTITYTPDMDSAQTLLSQVFGFETFRPLQAEIIQSILQGQDALAVMPTGSGKSLCYQLPALLFPGLTVVVSPLISLMQDQVEQLRELGIAAVTLNSSLTAVQYDQAIQQIQTNTAKLLYVAPETLLRPTILALLKHCRVDCLTIDEAHCISEWGHDFRPEYRQLIAVRQQLAEAVCLTVTATATDRVRQDIKTSLGIPDAAQFIASFDRPNLHLSIAAKTDGLAQTMDFLTQHRGQSGIIYCATRKQVDTLTAQLEAHGWPARPYHAGLDDFTRRRHQHEFIHDDVPIMVATVAFGMGINKSNVRFVLHYDLPKSIENYYQQIGRAGRDGLQSDCLLLFSYADVQTINYFIMQQDDSQQRGARMRLEALLAFVETNLCRRRPLLDYFGETYQPDTCSLCDNCQTDEQSLVDITVPAQKFLSCVKRTGEMFGTNHIIDVLRGSRSQKILSRGHERLSTYNIGGEFSKKEWQYLARQFVQQKLLTQDINYGSLKLTAKAYAVFQGEEKVMGTVLQKTDRPAALAMPIAHDVALFAQLQAKRKQLAQEAGLPPYIIFSDRSLVEMAAYFPQSRTTFGRMYGVGEAKLAKYAHHFLPIIQAHCQAQGITEKQKQTAVTRPTTMVPQKSRREEVIEWYNNGRSVPEIAEIYHVKHKTVLDHLWHGVLAGYTLRNSDLCALSHLSSAMQQQVLAAFAQHGVERLRPIYDALNETVSFDELHLLRLHFVITQS